MDFSFLDPLTAVFNKKHATPEFEKAWLECKASGDPFAVMFIDVDHLKAFNDQRSLTSGDKAIKVIASVLVDIWTRDVAPCRWGGEEFLVMLRGFDIAAATQVAEGFRRRIEKKVFPDFQTGEPVSVTVSIGLGSGTNDANFQGLLQRADEALNQAKSAGRNRVVAS